MKDTEAGKIRPSVNRVTSNQSNVGMRVVYDYFMSLLEGMT
jgi:hypothetical protein